MRYVICLVAITALAASFTLTGTTRTPLADGTEVGNGSSVRVAEGTEVGNGSSLRLTAGTEVGGGIISGG